MRPILFHLGPVAVRSWGVMVATGILAGLFLANRTASRLSIESEKILNLSFYLVLAGILGGRIIYVLLDLPYFLSRPIEMPMINLGGLSIQGAILGSFIAGYLYSRYHKLSFGQIADIFAPSLLLGIAIGRIGCFLNGDSYGKLTNFFLGVRFANVPGVRHPVQLYESILVLGAFFLIFTLKDRLNKEGNLFSLAIIAYSLMRFGVEFVRDSEILMLGLSYAQVASLATVLVFAIVLVRQSSTVLAERR